MARHIISEERESCKCDKNTRRGKRRGSGKSISEGGMQREARAGEGKKKRRVGEGWMSGGGGGVSWVECGQRLITSAGSMCRDSQADWIPHSGMWLQSAEESDFKDPLP